MMRTTRRRRIARLVVFVLPLFFLFLAGVIWVCRELWNGLMPSIFGLGTITYWQALGLMVLSWILFRGFRGPGTGHGAWRYDMRRRWEKMTPAEREEFVRGLNARCGSPSPASPGPPPAP